MSAGAGAAGDLAIVLHSHMPYVEGFGTYPFGEEWLFDAVVRSYLPVLEVARDLTMTVTPVLADQLEDAGTAERLRRFLLDFRIGGAEADLRDVGEELRPACAAERDRYAHALALLDAAGGDPLAPFRRVAAEGRVALAASAATHALLPLLATRAGLRLQLDAGIRSHRRRFGWEGGFWLPECAYEPGLEWELARAGVAWFCVDQSAHEEPFAALRPVATEAGPVALPIDWEAISWLWSLGGYPADPAYAQFDGKSLRGMRLWRIGGGAYDPVAAAAAARRQAGEFLAAIAARLRTYAAERGRRGLVVFAIDTELLGHWWSEGPLWLAAVLEGAAAAGVRLVSVPTALEDHEPQRRPLRRASWGEGKDFSTWDSPPVADLAWAARRLELALLGAVRGSVRGADAGGWIEEGGGLDAGATGSKEERGGFGAGAAESREDRDVPARGGRAARARAERAARELLAAQASDWAFLDRRGQAGDYAWQRATAHSQALYEAIGCDRDTDPRMRSLAPDLSLTPLLEP